MKTDKKGTVLIVDNEPANLSVLSDHLQQAGFKVLAAEDGESALRGLSCMSPDIALLDINLPDIDGFELCRRLKEFNKDIPVIFLSSLTDIQVRLRGLDLDTVDHITKPFYPEEVIARVKKHLMVWNLQKSLQEKNLLLEQEIAERKQAEEALRASQKTQDAILSSTDVLLAYMDREFNFIAVNQSYAEAGCRNREDFVGKNHFELYPHEENQMLFESVVETGDALYISGKPFEHPDQPERGTTWWNWSLIPMKDESGEVHSLVFSLLDITELKRAEEALRESEEKYRLITETVEVGIYSTDNQGNYTFSNSTHTKMFGYTQEEIIGMNYSAMFPKSTLEQGHALVAKLQSGENIKGEITVRRKDGHEFPISFNGVPIIKHNEVTGITGFAQDITERRQAEDALKAKNDDLKALNQIFVDRELAMIELKKEINRLLKDAGKEARYEDII